MNMSKLAESRLELQEEDCKMLYVTLLDEVMDSPHRWEEFTSAPVLDDRSEMSIKISDLCLELNLQKKALSIH